MQGLLPVRAHREGGWRLVAFVHHFSIQCEGFRTLAEGEVVEFEPVDGQKGKQAAHVVKIQT